MHLVHVNSSIRQQNDCCGCANETTSTYRPHNSNVTWSIDIEYHSSGFRLAMNEMQRLFVLLATRFASVTRHSFAMSFVVDFHCVASREFVPREALLPIDQQREWSRPITTTDAVDADPNWNMQKNNMPHETKLWGQQMQLICIRQ